MFNTFKEIKIPKFNFEYLLKGDAMLFGWERNFYIPQRSG
jgi:hypothetical protein